VAIVSGLVIAGLSDFLAQPDKIITVIKIISDALLMLNKDMDFGADPVIFG